MSSLPQPTSPQRQGGAPVYASPIDRPAPHYCEIEAYDREIDEVKAYLRKLIYARRALKQSIRMKARYADPVQKEALKQQLRQGVSRFWSDPDRSAGTREKHRNNKLAADGLPPMTREQKLRYRDLRRRGGKNRRQALALVLGTTP